MITKLYQTEGRNTKIRTNINNKRDQKPIQKIHKTKNYLISNKIDNILDMLTLKKNLIDLQDNSIEKEQFLPEIMLRKLGISMQKNEVRALPYSMFIN